MLQCPYFFNGLFKNICPFIMGEKETIDDTSIDVYCVESGHELSALTVRSARFLTPHNRSQDIQTNTTRGFIQSVLLTTGIMMPETCSVNLL